MYTYVLFGQPGARSAAEDDPTKARYLALLAEVTKAKMVDDWWVWKRPLPDGQINLFSIPLSIETNGGLNRLDGYNFDLASLYLARIGSALISDREVAARFTVKPGPFLVSTLVPLPDVGTGQHLLYCDLSDTHPAAMAEDVGAYKQRVHTHIIGKEEAFSPFRLRLLSVVLDANDSVGLLKTQVAAWAKTP